MTKVLQLIIVHILKRIKDSGKAKEKVDIDQQKFRK